MRFLSILVVLSVSFACNISDGQEWPQFRGPGGDGHAIAKDLPLEFDDATAVAWKLAVPGRAWSSPVIVENEIWLSAALETLAVGEEKVEKLKTADMVGLSAFSRVDLVAVCVDRTTGKLVNSINLFTLDAPPLIHTLNSFASPTPVADNENVYFHFGTYGTACVNRKSKQVLWKTKDYNIEHQTGPGSSPILDGPRLVLNCDGCDSQFVVALDKRNGEEIWRIDRSGEMHAEGMYKKAFSTPIIIKQNDRPVLVSAAANWVYGYDPETGKELWKVSYGRLGFSNVARPVVGHGMLFVCSCFMKSRLIAIRLDSSELSDDNIAWSYERQVPNMPSPILVGDNIYFVSDRGIGTCLDAKTGEEKWRERLGGDFSASPLFADGKLFFCNRDGEVLVVAPGDEFELVARNKLDSRIMASPAAVDDALYIRTEKSLYCFKKK